MFDKNAWSEIELNRQTSVITSSLLRALVYYVDRMGEEKKLADVPVLKETALTEAKELAVSKRDKQMHEKILKINEGIARQHFRSPLVQSTDAALDFFLSSDPLGRQTFLTQACIHAPLMETDALIELTNKDTDLRKKLTPM